MTRDLVLSPGVERAAVLSDDGVHRYELSRRWDHGPQITWVMLNPSTADALVDDPTIRRCIGFSRRWGFGRLAVVNLYAYRATDPAELGRASDPVGPENAEHIDRNVAAAEVVVAAWGAHSWASMVADAMLAGHRPLFCLGRTKAGHPRHPLYVPAATPLELWRGEAS